MKFYELCRYIWQTLFPRIEEAETNAIESKDAAAQSAANALISENAAKASEEAAAQTLENVNVEVLQAAEAAVESVSTQINLARDLAEGYRNEAQAQANLSASFARDAQESEIAAQSAEQNAVESVTAITNLAAQITNYTAFQDATFVEENAVVTIKKQRYSPITDETTYEYEALPIAVAPEGSGGGLSGLMPKESLAALNAALEKIETLEGAVSRYDFDLGATPAEGWTQEQLNGAYYAASATPSGSEIPNGVILVNSFDPADYEYQRTSSGWAARQFGVRTATNTALGIVKGSSSGLGKVFVESDGSQSVIGLDGVNTTAQNALSGADAANAKIVPLPVTVASQGVAGDNGHDHILNLSARKVIAGTGLKQEGDGNLGADVTISLGNPGTITPQTANAVNGQAHTHALDLDSAGFNVFAKSATEINAGNGLTGGGNLSANRSLALIAPATITPTSTNSAGSLTAGHSHQFNVPIVSPNWTSRGSSTRAWKKFLTVTLSGNNALIDVELGANNNYSFLTAYRVTVAITNNAVNSPVNVYFGGSTTLAPIPVAYLFDSTARTLSLYVDTTYYSFRVLSYLGTLNTTEVVGTTTMPTGAVVIPAIKFAVNTQKVSAGVGLSGGGDLSADRTISMGTPSSLTGATANSVSGTTHTHTLAFGNTLENISSLAPSGTGSWVSTPTYTNTTSALQIIYAFEHGTGILGAILVVNGVNVGCNNASGTSNNAAVTAVVPKGATWRAGFYNTGTIINRCLFRMSL